MFLFTPLVKESPEDERSAFNRKIFAIKETRRVTRWGLKDSKEFVDSLYDRLGVDRPLFPVRI